ncbi:hypothetical protein VTJ04DRAFT_5764 [Mycothermus thermophilus]|uniref:uncharacterized protein n=1 Tax=Humicola insolens TaxID=85995 RepID=UPI003742BD45
MPMPTVYVPYAAQAQRQPMQPLFYSPTPSVCPRTPEPQTCMMRLPFPYDLVVGPSLPTPYAHEKPYRDP